MENKTNQPAPQDEPKDERAEWITPAIADYDIKEATLTTVKGGGGDAGGYS